MKKTIEEFQKTKDFLVCVDSDGCAMDTMDIKHKRCFGPKVVEIWELQSIAEEFLAIWNGINLYSKTRGINRFKGLVKAFEVVAAKGMDVPDFSSISRWVQESKELSNFALEKTIQNNNDEELRKVLQWSQEVNQAIVELGQEDQPFPKVKEGLEAMSQLADIAIVSSANGKAVEDEWTRHGLISYVQVLLGQEAGSKADCIAGLKANRFLHDQVLMIGDAPGDLEAAQKNGVLYYPILVGREEESWEKLIVEGFPRFIESRYEGEYQQRLIDEFNRSLE